MKAIIVAALLMLPHRGQAEVRLELAFMGSLEKLVLIPRQRPGCMDPIAEEGHIYVSNHCGCGFTTFRILNSVKPRDTELYSTDFRIGEWCDPGISIFQGAEFLVYQAEGNPLRWVESVATDSGKPAFMSKDLEILFRELELESADIGFGPEVVKSCVESQGEFLCNSEPVVLADELLEALHVTSRPTRPPRSSSQ